MCIVHLFSKVSSFGGGKPFLLHWELCSTLIADNSLKVAAYAHSSWFFCSFCRGFVFFAGKERSCEKCGVINLPFLAQWCITSKIGNSCRQEFRIWPQKYRRCSLTLSYISRHWRFQCFYWGGPFGCHLLGKAWKMSITGCCSLSMQVCKFDYFNTGTFYF